MSSKLAWVAIAAAWFSLCPLAAGLWSDGRSEAAPQRRPTSGQAVEEGPIESAQSPAPGSDRREDLGANPGRRRSGAWRWRGSQLLRRSHPTVLAAFRQAVRPTKAATVRILVDGQPAALGAVVDPDGYVVSKASLLGGETICRLADDRELPARLVGTDEENDLALLKVEAAELTPVAWRPAGPPPVGNWVATVGQQDDPLAIGVISAESRPIPGSRWLPSRRGVLGVSLAQAPTGPQIEEVFEGGAAEAVGLKVGDRVRSIDGRPVRTVEQMVETVGSHLPGSKITLLVERGDERVQLTPTLGKPQPDSRRWIGPEDHWGGGPFSERRYGFPSALPHDTVLSPTDCGGPLVDTDGKVVGINVARALRVTSYAIPAEVVRRVVAELKKKARSDGSAKAEAR